MSTENLLVDIHFTFEELKFSTRQVVSSTTVCDVLVPEKNKELKLYLFKRLKSLNIIPQYYSESTVCRLSINSITTIV